MSISTDNRFNTRAFVVSMAVFTGLSLPFTGLANHLSGFEPLTTSRHAWMAAHNVMGILFAFFVTWHVVLNRRSLAHHLRKAAPLSREAKIAAAITASLLFVAIGHAFVGGAAR